MLPAQPLDAGARISPLQCPPGCGVAAFIDVETTGLESYDEIIELALVLFWFDRSTGGVVRQVAEYVGLRQPSRPIHPDAAKVNGLTLADVAGHRLDDGLVESLLAQADVILAHNAPFDRRFVAPMFQAARSKPWLCTMKGIAWTSRSRRLQDLLALHSIQPGQAHRAASDVRAAIELIGRPGPDGRPYLAQLVMKLANERP